MRSASVGSSFSSTSNAPTLTPPVALPSRKNSNSYSMEYLYLNLGEGQRAGSRLYIVSISSLYRPVLRPPHATRPPDFYTPPYKYASPNFL